MPFLPFQILGIWFRGLLSVAILAGGIGLLRWWHVDSLRTEVVIPAGAEPGSEAWKERVLQGLREGETRRVFRYDPGWNRPTALLAGGIALLAWATAGRWIGKGLFLLTLRPGT